MDAELSMRDQMHEAYITSAIFTIAQLVQSHDLVVGGVLLIPIKVN